MQDEQIDRWDSPIDDEDEDEGTQVPEELIVRLDDEDDDIENDLDSEELYDTQRSDGHTANVHKAMEQGLTWTPPTDPPTIPSRDDPEGVEIGAGFGPSMEHSGPDVEDLPDRVDTSDLEMEEDVYEMLRFNSETQHLDNIRVRAGNGVVVLLGSVPDDDDLDRVFQVLEDLEGVREIRSHLTVAADEQDEQDQGYLD